MPLPNLLRKSIDLHKKALAIKSKLLTPYESVQGDAKLYILKRSNKGDLPFKVLAVINDFGMEAETWRSKMRFEVPTYDKTFGEKSNESFGDIIARASHVYVHPDLGMFNIKDGDEVQAFWVDFSYKIYGVQVSDEFEPTDYAN